MKLKLTVNGEERDVDVSPWKRLLDVLREDLRLTGTKEGCGEGECGACSVRLDGEVVNSCLVAVGQCSGRRVTTVEGLGAGPRVIDPNLPDRGPAGPRVIDPNAPDRGPAGEVLHAVQRELVRCGGAQCGICTPGIAVCASYVVDNELLKGKDEATARAAVRELLAGNICRCTGYQLIVDAVIAAARGVES